MNREFSRLYRSIPKLVVSDGYEVPAAEGGDIVVFASHVLWNGLLAEGLVDRLDLVVGPDAIGDGVPAFTAPARLTPLDAALLPGSRNLLVRYAPA